MTTKPKTKRSSRAKRGKLGPPTGPRYLEAYEQLAKWLRAELKAYIEHGRGYAKAGRVEAALRAYISERDGVSDEESARLSRHLAGLAWDAVLGLPAERVAAIASALRREPDSVNAVQIDGALRRGARGRAPSDTMKAKKVYNVLAADSFTDVAPDRTQAMRGKLGRLIRDTESAARKRWEKPC